MKTVSELLWRRDDLKAYLNLSVLQQTRAAKLPIAYIRLTLTWRSICIKEQRNIILMKITFGLEKKNGTIWVVKWPLKAGSLDWIKNAFASFSSTVSDKKTACLILKTACSACSTGLLAIGGSFCTTLPIWRICWFIMLAASLIVRAVLVAWNNRCHRVGHRIA